jgi:hypothetical protein
VIVVSGESAVRSGAPIAASLVDDAGRVTRVAESGFSGFAVESQIVKGGAKRMPKAVEAQTRFNNGPLFQFLY